jgi:hypothetical protein
VVRGLSAAASPVKDGKTGNGEDDDDDLHTIAPFALRTLVEVRA